MAELVGVLLLGGITAIAFRLSTGDNRLTRLEIYFNQALPFKLGVTQLIILLILVTTCLLALKAVVVLRLSFFAADSLAFEESRISTLIFDSLFMRDIEEVNVKTTSHQQFIAMGATGRLTNSVVMPLLNVFADVFSILLLLTTVIIVSPLTGLSMLLILSLTYFLMNKRLSKTSRKYGEVLAIDGVYLNDLISASIRGMKEVRTYGQERKLIGQFQQVRNNLARVTQRSTLINGIFRFVADLTVLILGIIFLCIQLLVEDDLRRTVATLILFLAVGYRLIPAIQRLQGTITSLRLSYPTVKPLIEMNSRGELADRQVISESQSTIVEFQNPVRIVGNNLTFSYSRNNNAPSKMFSKINFEMLPSSISVLWGKSGSGKTTLLDIIAGLRRPSAGTLEYYSDSTLILYEFNKSYVTQEPFLRKGMLVESLFVDDCVRDLQMDKAIELLKRFQLKEDFWNLRNFELEENSKNISGGERQRLSLIKAGLSSNSVVLIDEPTSALDERAKFAVIEFLQEFKENRTVVVATHDEDLRSVADQVIDLNRK